MFFSPDLLVLQVVVPFGWFVSTVTTWFKSPWWLCSFISTEQGKVECDGNQKLAYKCLYFELLLHSHAVFTVCHTQPHLMLSIALPTHTCLAFYPPLIHTNTQLKCSQTGRRSTKKGETQRASQLTYSRTEWWPAGRKSIAGGETPSKLSMGPTSRYCRQGLIHKAGVSAGTKGEAGGSSLISIRALNYRGPWRQSRRGNLVESHPGLTGGFMSSGCCIID